MALRDDNPFIDSDLSLIISTFERGMSRSRDESAIIAPFRRQINTFSELPISIINTISSVPAFQESVVGGTGGIQSTTTPSIPTRESAIVDDEERTEEVENPSEDADDQSQWIDKVKKWAEDCIPCEFRKWSKEDPNFFSDISTDWEDMLKKIDFNLDSFKKDLLDNNDIFADLCEIATQLKGQCIPDLSKMSWMLNFMMMRMETDFSFNFGSFDTMLTEILSPVFNEMISNLDLLGDLALSPIKCIIDQLIVTIQGFVRKGQQAANTIQNPPIPQSQEQALIGDRRRQQAREQIRQSEPPQLEPITRALKDAREIDPIKRLKDYLEVGMKHVEQYKDWLLGMLKELIESQTDQWDQNKQSGMQKLDLLRLDSVINAMIQAAKDGRIACGPEEDSLSEDDFRTIVNTYLHPSTPLEISLEDDNLVIQRPRRAQNIAESNATANTTSPTTGAVTPDVIGGDKPQRAQLPNLVFKKPISSCLKKVTAEEVGKVQLWIQQLEDELAD
jgi:hypothetical protein